MIGHWAVRGYAPRRWEGIVGEKPLSWTGREEAEPEARG